VVKQDVLGIFHMRVQRRDGSGALWTSRSKLRLLCSIGN
jgi:hypothetical protein